MFKTISACDLVVKLVRDHIPERLRIEGKEPEYFVLSSQQFDQALRLKVVEEANEISRAEGDCELLEEAADLLEVLESLLANRGIEKERLVAVKRKKREACGGFEKRQFLIRTKPA